MMIGICDDEKKFRRQLRKLIEVHAELQGISCVTQEYESGSELLGQLPERQPDILFLDIEMPGMSGMDTARSLRASGYRMLIIFVTAYPDYVFEGYEVQAFHYILKPYQEYRIKKVLDLAARELQVQTQMYYAVEQKSGTLRLNLNQICYFKSEGRRVCSVDREGQTVFFYQKLDDVQRGLPDYFKRVHKRYLVNLNYVSRVESTRCVCSHEDIPVSRTYCHEMAAAFAQMMLK